MAAEGAAGTAGSRAGTVAVTARVVWTAAREARRGGEEAPEGVMAGTARWR